MSEFAAALAARQPPNIDKRRWLIVPYDQLSDQIGPLARENPKELGLVVVENPWKAARRPYHQQKLALVLANLRHFSLEQASRGVAIRHVVAAGPYQTAIEPLLAELGPLRMMEPAERELRVDLEPLVDAGSVELIPHEGWLTSDDDLTAGRKGGPPWAGWTDSTGRSDVAPGCSWMTTAGHSAASSAWTPKTVSRGLESRRHRNHRASRRMRSPARWRSSFAPVSGTTQARCVSTRFRQPATTRHRSGRGHWPSVFRASGRTRTPCPGDPAVSSTPASRRS